jgi:predicted Zn finger-like uncharacterized protein
MITLCPHCATRFRVTSEQLAARQGLVRCGYCQGVFNGFEHLHREGGTEAGAGQQVASSSRGEATNIAPSADTSLHADHLTGHIEAPTPAPNWAPAADTIAIPQTIHPAADNKPLLALHLLRGYVHADPPAPVWTPLVDKVTEPAARAETPTAPETPSEEALEAFALSLASAEVAPVNGAAGLSDAIEPHIEPHIEPLADPQVVPPALAAVLRTDLGTRAPPVSSSASPSRWPPARWWRW